MLYIYRTENCIFFFSYVASYVVCFLRVFEYSSGNSFITLEPFIERSDG